MLYDARVEEDYVSANEGLVKNRVDYLELNKIELIRLIELTTEKTNASITVTVNSYNG
jgi:nucleoid-associated protein YejK